MDELPADLFDGAGDYRRMKGCSVGHALAKMSPESREVVHRALANPDISARWIEQKLQEAGYTTVGNQAVGRHRRRDCTCQKS